MIKKIVIYDRDGTVLHEMGVPKLDLQFIWKCSSQAWSAQRFLGISPLAQNIRSRKPHNIMRDKMRGCMRRLRGGRGA